MTSPETIALSPCCSVADVYLLWSNLDQSFYNKKCVVDFIGFIMCAGSVASSCGYLLVGLLWWKWTEPTPCQSSGKL